MSLEVMEWCKKEDSIEDGSLDHGEFIEHEHITYSKLRIRMKSSSFFDHPERAIQTEIRWKNISLFFCFFEESPISTADIEYGSKSPRFHICKDKVEFWPRMIFPTFWECMSKMIVRHILLKNRIPSFKIPTASPNNHNKSHIYDKYIYPEKRWLYRHIRLSEEDKKLGNTQNKECKKCFCPGEYPSFLESRKIPEKIYNNTENHRQENIFCIEIEWKNTECSCKKYIIVDIHSDFLIGLYTIVSKNDTGYRI